MSGWSFDLSVILFLLALTCFYAVGLARGERRDPAKASRFSARALAAVLGILTLALALLSPLDTLGDRGLFVAHMAQHLLLLLVVPVGLIAGAPWGVIEAARAFTTARFGRLATSLPVALLANVGAIWLWHVPRLFDAALQSGTVHLLEHATFVGTALLFCWPVVRPNDVPRRAPELVLLLYLFAAAIACSTLGALITLSGEVLYSTGVAAQMASTAAAVVGLTRIQDQELGGILMWGFGGLWYFIAAGVIFGQWFSRSLAHEEGRL
jgi:putative membrane protein